MGFLDLTKQNLMSPMVLFFILGAAASFLRSDLSVPEAIARFLSLYLLMAIGFKGGVEVTHNGLTTKLMAGLGAGILLSALIPLLAYALLRAVTNLTAIDAAALAGHYGSISAVTFAAITGVLTQINMPYEGYMAAIAAAMETPAIFTALAIAHYSGRTKQEVDRKRMLREIALNGSIVMLIGSFMIGVITGDRGLTSLKPFLIDPYAGFLSLFLLDMGLLAGRGLAKGWRLLSGATFLFAIVMPIVSALIAALLSHVIGLSTGGTAILITLAASSSYIAVPAAMRIALPEANPAISLTLSLGVTFPFNLTFGIPLYIAAASYITG
jgi:hypothetical protein